MRYKPGSLLAGLFATLVVMPLSVAFAQDPSTRARTTPVVACAYSPNGGSLVIARHDRVEVRNVLAGDSRTLDIKIPRAAAIAFDPTGQLLAVAGGTPGESGVVILWDFKASKSLAKVEGMTDLATAVAFSPDGSLLAVGSADRTVRLTRIDRKRDALQTRSAGVLVGHGGAVTSVVFSPDSKLIATSSVDRSIKVWTVTDGALLRTLSNHTDSVHAIAGRSHSDPKAPWTIASASDDRTVRIWQPGIGRMVRIVRGHEGPVLAVAWAADGKTLLSLGTEGIVRAIECDGDQILRSVPAHADWGYAIAVSPDGRSFATGGWAGDVVIWKIDKSGSISPADSKPGSTR
ncbi:WD40 repeat domain-containing protein [Humisphaera borealis]|uniref:WD40 repeat domain-containing protein n=1 Tax=Humisphaera borealis TaxID=2807512 RepID=A0A7M2WYN7_9BACT|nr:WD40 repeat domain-containing protein [Humisphaera borealis]QOV90586.1 WD40 repeat domain-containing protein [Humisphaera borealis]